MGGQTSSKPLAEELAEDELDAFEATLGVPSFSALAFQTEAAALMVLPPSEARKLTPEQADFASLTLTQYAAYLSRAAQREEARAHWARETVRRMTDPVLDNFRGYLLEERRAKAILADPKAQRVDRLRVLSEVRHRRILHMARHAGEVAKSFKSLSITRRATHDR